MNGHKSNHMNVSKTTLHWLPSFARELHTEFIFQWIFQHSNKFHRHCAVQENSELVREMELLTPTATAAYTRVLIVMVQCKMIQ